MVIVCRKCRRAIEPDDEMLVVTIGKLETWADSERLAQRLDFAPGRWHYRCAPMPVKKYAAAVSV